MLSPPPRSGVHPSPSRPALLRRATTGIGFGSTSLKHTRASTGSSVPGDAAAGAGASGVSVVTGLEDDVRGMLSPPLSCRPSIADENSGRVRGAPFAVRGTGPRVTRGWAWACVGRVGLLCCWRRADCDLGQQEQGPLLTPGCALRHAQPRPSPLSGPPC
jgi:hypothetical protein